LKNKKERRKLKKEKIPSALPKRNGVRIDLKHSFLSYSKHALMEEGRAKGGRTKSKIYIMGFGGYSRKNCYTGSFCLL
jgi:hypothetical protein